MQPWPQLCTAQTDTARVHDLHPSHGFDFCGISGLTFSKTRSLSLHLRVGGIFMNSAHKMPPGGYRNSRSQRYLSHTCYFKSNLSPCASVSLEAEQKFSHCPASKGHWQEKEAKFAESWVVQGSKPQPTFRCPWDLGPLLVWKSKWIAPAMAHILGLVEPHAQGIELKGSQLPLLTLHKAFPRFSTWPSTTPLLQHTPFPQLYLPTQCMSPWQSPDNIGGTHLRPWRSHQGSSLACPSFLPSAFPVGQSWDVSSFHLYSFWSSLGIVGVSFKKNREREIRETRLESDPHSKSSKSKVFCEASVWILQELFFKKRSEF